MTFYSLRSENGGNTWRIVMHQNMRSLNEFLYLVNDYKRTHPRNISYYIPDSCIKKYIGQLPSNSFMYWTLKVNIKEEDKQRISNYSYGEYYTFSYK